MSTARRLAVLALPLAAAAPILAQSLQTTFAAMDKVAPNVKTVEADLRRDIYTAVVDDHTIQTGSIRFRREKGGTRMLIEITSPQAESVEIGPSTASVYYPKIKTVQVYDLGNKKDLVDAFLLLGFGATSQELEQNYAVTWVGMESINGKPAARIQLIPKSKEVAARLPKAELWIGDNGLPLQQKFVTSASGDFMLVTYSNLKLNPSIAESSLKLNLPKGVKTEHPQH